MGTMQDGIRLLRSLDGFLRFSTDENPSLSSCTETICIRRTPMKKRILSLFLALSMVLSLVPTAASVEPEETQTLSSTQGQTVLYSDQVLTFSPGDGLFPEDSGSQTLTLTRANGIDQTQHVTLAIYDISANYGDDYQLSCEGVTPEKLDGACSIYDVFRDQGQLTSGQMLDLSVMAGQVASIENGETPQDVSAADMMAQLDALGVKAVSLPLTFAAGEDSLSLTVELIDDLEAEYDEYFMAAVFDEAGQLVQSTQQIFTIADNDSPTPDITVCFDCDETLELDEESGEAELVFQRTGNLATNSQSALCLDGEPIGWVDFAPWQDVQTVWVIQAGTYTILDDDGSPMEDQQVIVEDNRPTETAAVPDGADPDLDALVESYAVIKTPRQSAYTGWLPGWATGTETDSEDAVIILGNTDSNLFKAGGNTSKGEAEFFVDGNNFHDLCSSGTFSRVSTGYLYADSIKSYDLTGVESITADVYTEGVDGDAKISIGVQSLGLSTQTISSGGKYTLTYTLPDKCQETKYIYYKNEDPNKTSGGISMYFPNGFKMNLREYRFIIEDSSEYVTPLTYTGGTKPGDYVPQITSSKAEQYMTINSKIYGSNKTVDIVYSCDSQYPAKLIGYKLRNAQTGEESDMISLTDGSDGSGGTASFTFDAAFLNKYEADYCVKTQNAQGTEAWTFQIIPVYEKVTLDFYVTYSTRQGTVEMVDQLQTHYLGDIAVFEDTETEATLVGVWYQAKSAISDTIKDQGISENRYDVSKNQYKLSLLYPRYTFKGVYSSEEAQLLTYYTDNTTSARGTLEKEGQIVSSEQYVVGDYVSLVAKAKDGHVTQWDVDGTKYYGDVFYYQLDGHPDNNLVEVDFPAADTLTATTTLTGTLTRADVELRSENTVYRPMAYTQITITADKTYTATTDSSGNFSIPNFTGVKGGTYSMAVNYDTAIGYTYFTYTVTETNGTAASEPLSVKMTQYPAGVPYPDGVLADVDGSGSNQNMLELTTDGTVNATVRVYQPPKNYTVTGVNFYFLSETLADAGATADATAFAAAYASTSGNIQTWSVSVGTDQINNGTRLYVEVISNRTTYLNKADGTTETTTASISSGLVDCGYGFTIPNAETVYYSQYDIIPTPGLNNAVSIDLSKLNLPNLGNLDFSVSSLTGGFFSSRTDSNGDLILTCGSSYLSSFATGPVSEKLAQKRAAQQAVEEKKASNTLSDRPVGGSDTTITAVTPGEAESGNGSLSNTEKTPSNWAISPAFLFKIVVTQGTEDPDTNYISLYEMSLGVDASFARNIPFNVNGVPLYVCLTFTTEAYFDLQVAFQEDSFPLLNFMDTWYDMLENGGFESIDAFIAAPVMRFGVTGGVGYNGFLSAYIQAAVSAPFIFSIYPVDAAVQPSFTIGGGVNVVVFNMGLDLTVSMDPIGNEDLIEDLKTIMASAATGTDVQSLQSSGETVTLDSLDALEQLDLTTLFDDATFCVMERSGSLRRSSQGSGYVATDVFRDTGIHLHQLKDGTLLAFYLQDTAGTDEDTLNWLSVVCAESHDNGDTWSTRGFVSNNTGNPNTSLQFDINLFQLEDRTLITWSEANFDEVLENLGDVDVTRLTPAQVAKFMNAMDLKGRFLDSTTGEFLGDSFTIAENSTVACGALDAVQNGDTVYVYYQRNIFPCDDTTEEVTLSDLLATERTIAMARADVNDCSQWVSTSVRAMNENGQEYRITDVAPFVHDGILGEILVLDRDGQLAQWNDATQSWDNSTDDRQLYLRTYTFAEDGTPQPSALLELTDPSVCAQSPQVVSNESYLYLFWNQNGKVVYLADFVATDADHPDVQSAAYVVQNSDGTATTQHKGEYSASDIASDGSFHAGSTFSATMDSSGNVLLSWIASDTTDGDILPTDEIYGVVLNTITNAEAAVGGNEALCQLRGQGAPVALTDEDSLIQSLDSLLLDRDGTFLLAFTKLNSTVYTQVTAAHIQTVKSIYAPELVITDISAPEYPIPGSEMTVDITIANQGLGTAEHIAISVSGIGDGASGTLENLQPGCSSTVTLVVDVPASFCQSTQLTIQANTVQSCDTAYTDILYGARFEIYEMPAMTNCPGTQDYWTQTLVYNAGNAAGIPTIDYAVTLFAVNQEATHYTYTLDTELAPGGTAMLTYVLEDTPVTEGKTGMLAVSTGDGADQYIQDHMPQLTSYLDVSGISGLTQDEPDTPNVPVSPGTSTAPSESESPTVTFTDISGHWAEDDILYAAANGLMNGMGDGLFVPDANTTRGMIVTILARLDGVDTSTGGIWYEAGRQWAMTNGISDGTNMDAPITREQLATMLCRYARYKGDDTAGFTGLEGFTDAQSVSDWAKDAMQWAVNVGLIQGYDNRLTPADPATRAQVAAILRRFLKHTSV